MNTFLDFLCNGLKLILVIDSKLLERISLPFKKKLDLQSIVTTIQADNNLFGSVRVNDMKT